ncbi:MAG TPA: RelA/SpoT family protein [Patescibacteria group bacterium]|nr:RelA/SpoT family protein [Patescibacteria group bacterium]
MNIKIDEVLKICAKYQSKTDLELIKKAYLFSDHAHFGQKRKSGEDYIQHPLQLAKTLAELGLDAPTIEAGLLHDTVEDAGINLTQIEKEFGKDVAVLVAGVTRVSKVRLKSDYVENNLNPREKSQLENLRKMFIAMSEDLRVIFIKLADRLHNMRTLYALPASKATRIARETLEIYAPIAHRLGIGEIKGELEDLAFPYVYPEDYKTVKSLVGVRRLENEIYVDLVISKIKSELKKRGIKFTNINGRAKHLYSLFKKLKKHNQNMSKIYDLIAIRIICKTVSDCYEILGEIHQFFKPLPGYIKDYIAMPKPNGYQSLHTTVFALKGRICEIQIRTINMHDHAEKGVAAHWHYTNNTGEKNEIEKRGIFAPKKEIAWIADLARWQEKLNNPQEFKKVLKMDFFSDRIFVFTPEGDVRNLPQSATPIDFAYSVHTEIGGTCRGAKVNGKMASLDYKLKNGDMIEIITAKNSTPRPDWLKLVKTTQARSKIRTYLKNKGLI